jgi:hypothetical protein
MEVRLKIQLMEKKRIKDASDSEPNYIDLVKLVRSIQRAEGNMDCYRRGLRQCDRMDCVWREHCLKEPGEPSTDPIGSQAKKETANPKQD